MVETTVSAILGRPSATAQSLHRDTTNSVILKRSAERFPQLHGCRCKAMSEAWTGIWLQLAAGRVGQQIWTYFHPAKALISSYEMGGALSNLLPCRMDG